MPLTRSFPAELRIFRAYLVQQHPFALSRVGTGEWRIAQGLPIQGAMAKNFGYAFDPTSDHTGQARMIASLQHVDPDYFVGICCPCCVGREEAEKQRAFTGLPERQLTWANLWANANYDVFVQEVLPLFVEYRTVLVCHADASLDRLPFQPAATFWIQKNAWLANYDATAAQLIADAQTHQGSLYLFCAGPLSNLLCLTGWQTSRHNTYLDLGSVLDPYLFPGRRGLSRRYLRGESTRHQVCVWQQGGAHDVLTA